MVRGFGETRGLGKARLYTDFSAANSALILAGLYRVWLHEALTQPVYSCSVITLPAHPKLAPYHPKASPLMLPPDPGVLDAWLSPHSHQTCAFDDLLTPHLWQPLWATALNMPSQVQPVGDAEWIPADSN